MKNLAELKRRLTPNVKVLLLWSKHPHKYIAKRRSIIKQQTNAIMFEGGSWLYWEKANNYRFFKDFPDKFAILENGQEFLIYEIVE